MKRKNVRLQKANCSVFESVVPTVIQEDSVEFFKIFSVKYFGILTTEKWRIILLLLNLSGLMVCL